MFHIIEYVKSHDDKGYLLIKRDVVLFHGSTGSIANYSNLLSVKNNLIVEDCDEYWTSVNQHKT